MLLWSIRGSQRQDEPTTQTTQEQEELSTDSDSSNEDSQYEPEVTQTVQIDDSTNVHNVADLTLDCQQFEPQ